MDGSQQDNIAKNGIKSIKSYQRINKSEEGNTKNGRRRRKYEILTLCRFAHGDFCIKLN